MTSFIKTKANKFYQMTNRSKEFDFDSWIKQFLIKVYLCRDRTSYDKAPSLLAIRGLRKTKFDDFLKYD